MKRITYLCVILHVKHKKWPILAVFTGFLILMAAKMSTIKLVTSHVSSSATAEYSIPRLVGKIKGFPLKVKYFEILQSARSLKQEN